MLPSRAPSRGRPPWPPAALAFALLTLVLGALGACTTPGTPVELHGDVHLTLLHTSDWHSRLFPYYQQVTQTDLTLGLDPAKAPFGGAARMNYLIQRERSRSDRVLHLDSGDCFEGAPVFNFFNGEAEIRSLNHTGVDAVVIGNHEFDRGGLNFARQYHNWASFDLLAANYQFTDPTNPGSVQLANLAHPYVLFNLRGLKVGVIGMGNLSSLTSIFDQPNSLGITALNTVETAQFYTDQLRAQGVDLVVILSHLGITDDQKMIESTSGIDVVLGGHNHIVLNPSQDVMDCAAVDMHGQHFVPQLDNSTGTTPVVGQTATCGADQCCDPAGVCRPTGIYPYWRVALGFHARACNPRHVLLQHSGAFVKYLGRLDTILSNDPARIYPGHPERYSPIDRYEVVAHDYTLFPVDSTVPEEPSMKQLLEPYARALDTVANLDTLVGYAPAEVLRTATNGGDSPLGNLVSTSMWLRLGIQTDFALTNTLGIRDNIPPGPVTVEQMYNVFPFDNSITTMNLAGREVREMFDFVARRSAGRGCSSQAQIAGARVVLVCGPCQRANPNGGMDTLDSCAETVNIGLRTDPAAVNLVCTTDEDCNRPAGYAATPPEQRSLCEPNAHRCLTPLSLNASYAVAVNNYIAAGGSGFFVLQRNTTQVDTGVQQRDAVIDFVRQGRPCLYDPAETILHNRARGVTDAVAMSVPQQPDDGLHDCQTDHDCEGGPNPEICGCPERAAFDVATGVCNRPPPNGAVCPRGAGRCVLQQCRDDVQAQFARTCPTVGSPAEITRCQCTAESAASQYCRILACVDNTVAFSDGRQRMSSR